MMGAFLLLMFNQLPTLTLDLDGSWLVGDGQSRDGVSSKNLGSQRG